MGEAHSTGIRFSFNGSIRIEGRGERLTGSAGSLLLREVDERLLGLTDFLGARLQDERAASLVQHPLSELLRTRLYGLALGHRRQDDMDDLRRDPGLRAAIADRRGVRRLDAAGAGLASQPTLSRLTRALSTPDTWLLSAKR